MHSLIKFSLLIFSTTSLATELTVVDKNLKYKLSFDTSVIHYETSDTSLTLKKSKCNAHINDRFLKKMNSLLKTPFLHESRNDFIEVTVDGKTGFEPKHGKRAVALLGMNEEIKKMKIEESLNCAK